MSQASIKPESRPTSIDEGDSKPLIISRMWTEPQLIKVQENPDMENCSGAEIAENHPDIVLMQGAVLCFASTQPKKISDAINVLKAGLPDIEVRDPLEILHWFLSADETSKTFTGNTYEKVAAILNRIYDTFGYQKFAARLKEKGLDPNNVVFCVNDSGASFNVDYSGEPEFKRSLHEKGLGSWPGVELGPVTDAQGGLPRFFADLRRMVERKKAGGLDVDLSGHDHQFYMMFKIRPCREDVRIFSFGARVPVTYDTFPLPADDHVLTSFHFSRLRGEHVAGAETTLTRAQMGRGYMQHYSAEALALHRFVEISGVTKTTKEAFLDSSYKIPKKPVIGTQDNLVPLGRSSDTNRKWRRRLKNALVGSSAFSPLKTIFSIASENGAYQIFTRHVDAVVLGKHSKQPTGRRADQYFLQMFDLWTSLIVDKQVRVESFEGKPFIVLNRMKTFEYEGKVNGELDWDDPNVERAFLKFIKNIDAKKDPWLKFILFTHYLHEKGLVKQEPRFLFDQMDPEDPELEAKIKNRLQQEARRQIDIIDYEREEFGTDETGLYELTILGSAGTRVHEYTEVAEALGEFDTWSDTPVHIRTGGGRYGVMGAAAQGAKKSMEHTEGHLSSIQMPRTLQFEGVSTNPKDIKGSENMYLSVEVSFDARMISLFRSDTIVALAGGIGTYQELLRFVLLKEANNRAVKDKKIILYNQKEPGEGGLRVFDVFLSMMPEYIIKRDFIITNSREELIQEVKKQQKHYFDLSKDRKDYPERVV